MNKVFICSNGKKLPKLSVLNGIKEQMNTLNKQNLQDGDTYLVTFNNGQDCVEATYIAEYQVFSHIAGSVSLDEAEKIEEIRP